MAGRSRQITLRGLGKKGCHLKLAIRLAESHISATYLCYGFLPQIFVGTMLVLW